MSLTFFCQAPDHCPVDSAIRLPPAPSNARTRSTEVQCTEMQCTEMPCIAMLAGSIKRVTVYRAERR
jgi:hypothetical protein